MEDLKNVFTLENISKIEKVRKAKLIDGLTMFKTDFDMWMLQIIKVAEHLKTVKTIRFIDYQTQTNVNLHLGEINITDNEKNFRELFMAECDAIKKLKSKKAIMNYFKKHYS
jgi:hypothetical protein